MFLVVWMKGLIMRISGKLQVSSKKDIILILFGNISFLFFCSVLLIKLASQFIYLPLIFVILSVVVLLVVIFLTYFFREKITNCLNLFSDKINNTSRFNCIVIIFLVSFIPKLIIGLMVGIDSRNVNIDIYIYQNIAYEIANNGIVTTYADYCNSFSHLLWFGMFLSPIIKIFGQNQMVLCICFDLLLSVSSVLLFVVFDNLSRVKTFLAIVLYCMLPSTVLLPQFITHEIPFLFFLSLSLWMYCKVMDNTKSAKQRTMFFILLLVSLSFSTMLNASGYVVCIAVLVHTFFLNRSEKLKYRIIKSGALVVCVVLLSFVFSNCVKPQLLSHEKLSTLKLSNVQWTLYVGSNAEENGGFSISDQKAFAWSFKDVNTLDDNGWSDDMVIDLRNNLYNTRIIDLIGNPLSAMKLLFTKIGKIWSFINYTYDAIPPLIENEQIKNSISNQLFPGLISFEIYMSIVVMIISIKNIRKSKFLGFSQYQISVLFLMGCTALFLLTECNSKYTISMQPFFWIVMMLNVSKPRFFKTKIGYSNKKKPRF